MTEIPDPLPLRTITPPPEVTQVAGCNCGGLDWHREDCAIWSLQAADRVAAVDAAHAREQAFADALNAKLRAVLGDPATAEDTYRQMVASECFGADDCVFNADCPFIADCLQAEAR